MGFPVRNERRWLAPVLDLREAKTAAVDILAKAKVAVAKAREDSQDK